MSPLFESVMQYLHVLAVAILVGKVVLLSFVVAPILAKQLAPEQFGKVVRQLFPAYYLLGMGAAVGGLVSVTALVLVRGLSPALSAAGGSPGASATRAVSGPDCEALRSHQVSP